VGDEALEFWAPALTSPLASCPICDQLSRPLAFARTPPARSAHLCRVVFSPAFQIVERYTVHASQ
jgi:hypothetical protein